MAIVEGMRRADRVRDLLLSLKGIGRDLQSGAEPAVVWERAERQIADVFRGTHPDEMILDELASTLTLADQHGKLYWGRTYAGILTVAVPRQWWPGKPGLAYFEKEISTAGRPISGLKCQDELAALECKPRKNRCGKSKSQSRNVQFRFGSERAMNQTSKPQFLSASSRCMSRN
jgi:hypothetical protein